MNRILDLSSDEFIESGDLVKLTCFEDIKRVYVGMFISYEPSKYFVEHGQFLIWTNRG